MSSVVARMPFLELHRTSGGMLRFTRPRAMLENSSPEPDQSTAPVEVFTVGGSDRSDVAEK